MDGQNIFLLSVKKTRWRIFFTTLYTVAYIPTIIFHQMETETLWFTYKL